MASSRNIHRFLNSVAGIFESWPRTTIAFFYLADQLFPQFQITNRCEMTSRAALHLLRQRQCVCLLARHHALGAGSASATSIHIAPSPTPTVLPLTRFKSTTQKASTPEIAGKKSQTKAASSRKKAAKEGVESKKDKIPDEKKSGIPKGLSSLIVPARNEIGSFPVAHKVSELIRR